MIAIRIPFRRALLLVRHHLVVVRVPDVPQVLFVPVITARSNAAERGVQHGVLVRRDTDAVVEQRKIPEHLEHLVFTRDLECANGTKSRVLAPDLTNS